MPAQSGTCTEVAEVAEGFNIQKGEFDNLSSSSSPLCRSIELRSCTGRIKYYYLLETVKVELNIYLFPG